MKKSVLVFLLLFQLSGNAQQWAWLKDQGGYVSGYPYPPKITSLANGDLITFNYFEIPGNGGVSGSSRIQRISSTGQVVWTDSTQGYHEVFQFLDEYAGNFYVACNNDQWVTGVTLPYTSNKLIAKIDKGGNRVWAKVLSGIFSKMGLAWNGDLVVIEYSNTHDGFIIERFDPNGNLISKTTIPVTVKDHDTPFLTLSGVACNNSGEVFVSGYYKADSIQIGNGPFSKSPDYVDAFILKINNSGIFSGVEFIKGLSIEGIHGDMQNNLYLLILSPGNSVTVRNVTVQKQYAFNYSGIGYFVAKLNSSGGCNWAKEIQRYGKFDDDLYYYMDVAASGDIYIGGKTLDTLHFGSTLIPLPAGLFVMKADSAANFLWAQSAVCSHTLYYNTFDISVAPNKAVYISGCYRNNLTAGSHQINGPDQQFVGMIIDGALTTNVSGEEINSVSFFTISPNPSSGELMIKASESISSINVYDLQMKLVGEKIPILWNRVNVSFLNPGVYIFEVKSTNAVQRRRVVIQ